MKRKLFPALAAVLILALALAGCAPQTAQAEYIGIDAAKTIALEAAGVSESAAVFSTTARTTTPWTLPPTAGPMRTTSTPSPA